MLTGSSQILLYLNPFGPALSANSRIWIDGTAPTALQFIAAYVWAVLTLLIGGYFFISRERDFAVRI
jgi:teichoic acid transport system permease protein